MQILFGDGYSDSLVTYDDTVTNIVTKDISLINELGEQVVNWQRWKVEVMAYNTANFLEMLNETYEFGCRWNGEFADPISSPITASFSEKSSPECDAWSVDISFDGDNVVIDVTGVAAQTIQWNVFTTQLVSLQMEI